MVRTVEGKHECENGTRKRRGEKHVSSLLRRRRDLYVNRSSVIRLNDDLMRGGRVIFLGLLILEATC